LVPGLFGVRRDQERLEIERERLDARFRRDRLRENNAARVAVLEAERRALSELSTRQGENLAALVAGAGPVHLQSARARRPEPSITAVQALLHPNEVFLDFLWAQDRLYRTRVTATSHQFVRLDDGLVNAFDSLTRRLDEQHRLTGSWALNGEFARSLLGLKPEDEVVILSPHDSMARFTGIPFHQLVPPNRTSAIVAGAAHFLSTRRDATTPPESVYLGLAAGHGIPGATFEVNYVAARYFDNSAEVHSAVTCDDLEALTGTVRLAHIASHASPRGLRLGADEDDPTSWAVPSMLERISLHADILLLTGCAIGLTVMNSTTNDFDGVVRALLAATGARAVVLSVDPVSDAAGLILTDLVTAALTGRTPGVGWGAVPVPKSSLSVGPALQAARLRLLGLAKNDLEAAEPTLAAQLRALSSTGSLPTPEWRWGRPWYLLGDPSAALAPSALNHLDLGAESEAFVPAGFGEDVVASWPIPTITLPDGAVVLFLQSHACAGGEMGAMDVFEASRRPGILQTSDGDFICWDDGHTFSGRIATEDEALEVMIEHLKSRTS